MVYLPGVALGNESLSLLLMTHDGFHNFPYNTAKEFFLRLKRLPLPKLGHRHFIVDVFSPLSLEARGLSE